MSFTLPLIESDNSSHPRNRAKSVDVHAIRSSGSLDGCDLSHLKKINAWFYCANRKIFLQSFLKLTEHYFLKEVASVLGSRAFPVFFVQSSSLSVK